MAWFSGLQLGGVSMPFGLPPAIVLGFVLLVLGVIVKASRRPANEHDGQVQLRQPEKSPPAQLAIEPLENFDWESVEPRQLRPFRSVYHITMGLQADAPSELITIDKDYLDRVNLRRSLIGLHGDRVHGCLPGGVEAVRELYTFLMADFLPTRFPTQFKLSDDKSQSKNMATGKTHATTAPEDPTAALRVLGETVEEDMFLLHETPNGHMSVALICCFPSGFDPSAKLGRLLRDIHTPVPSYEKIGASMERFFSKMQVGKSVKRTNWAIQTHDRLFNCKSHGTEDDVSANEIIDIDQTFFRVELQTLTRLPQTRALLFSFKTYMYPIRQIKDEGLGPELAEAVEGLKSGNAPGMWTYKGSVRWARLICEYLRS
ncbi:E3 ubiquitin-protein ligase hel2 [Tolypocladium paradoxum]|uniref:E3 ubiquitin-protein ligase hel2 n=1 Tax=Tolypocladium paradoxum TaxID=94208 RepID=A0A2S4KXQ3_9HYPO|nr:E3 ubiquitin-protein ligase hel2 [Tolypocladium paradoxum]